MTSYAYTLPFLNPVTKCRCGFRFASVAQLAGAFDRTCPPHPCALTGAAGRPGCRALIVASLMDGRSGLRPVALNSNALTNYTAAPYGSFGLTR